MMWALLIVLSTGAPFVSWHLSHGDCHQEADLRLAHYALTGQGVDHVECRSYQMPTLRPVTGEILTR